VPRPGATAVARSHRNRARGDRCWPLCSAALYATRSAALYATRSAALYATRSAALYATRSAALYATGSAQLYATAGVDREKENHEEGVGLKRITLPVPRGSRDGNAP
jgi:hypothetical protein